MHHKWLCGCMCALCVCPPDAAGFTPLLACLLSDVPAVTRLTKQPNCIQGVMRDYQLEGLNWMISLHENGSCRRCRGVSARAITG